MDDPKILHNSCQCMDLPQLIDLYADCTYTMTEYLIRSIRQHHHHCVRLLLNSGCNFIEYRFLLFSECLKYHNLSAAQLLFTCGYTLADINDDICNVIMCDEDIPTDLLQCFLTQGLVANHKITVMVNRYASIWYSRSVLNYHYVKGEFWSDKTILSEAAKYNRIDRIKMLIDYGIDISEYQYLAVREAACWGRLAVLKFFLNMVSIDVTGLLHVCLELIDYKCNILPRISVNDFYLCTQFLLELGADVNAFIFATPTPLYYILRGLAEPHRYRFLELLLQYGVHINDDAIILCFMFRTDLRTIKLLVEHNPTGLNISSINSSGEIYWIYSCGQIDVMKYLIESGCDINVCDGNLLFRAILEDDYDTAIYLLAMGGDISLFPHSTENFLYQFKLWGCNNKIAIPDKIKCQNSCDRTIQLLIDHGIVNDTIFSHIISYNNK